MGQVVLIHVSPVDETVFFCQLSVDRSASVPTPLKVYVLVTGRHLVDARAVAETLTVHLSFVLFVVFVVNEAFDGDAFSDPS